MLNIVIHENWKLLGIETIEIIESSFDCTVIIFSDIIFRFAVYCFTNIVSSESFFARKTEK